MKNIAYAVAKYNLNIAPLKYFWTLQDAEDFCLTVNSSYLEKIKLVNNTQEYLKIQENFFVVKEITLH